MFRTFACIAAASHRAPYTVNGETKSHKFQRKTTRLSAAAAGAGSQCKSSSIFFRALDFFAPFVCTVRHDGTCTCVESARERRNRPLCLSARDDGMLFVCCAVPKRLGQLIKEQRRRHEVKNDIYIVFILHYIPCAAGKETLRIYQRNPNESMRIFSTLRCIRERNVFVFCERFSQFWLQMTRRQ